MQFLLNYFPIYCEKLGLNFLTEPLNAISNFAFFIVAYFLYQSYRKSKTFKNIYFPLIFLTILIGLGSLLWHTHRSSITLLLDTVPIYILFLFIFYFVANFLFSKKITIFILFFYLFTQLFLLFYVPVEFLNGLPRHLFPFVLLLFLILLIYRKVGRVAISLLLPVAIFGLAIAFRTIDLSLCEIIPVGTHFLWHISNAVAIYFGVNALIKIKQAAMIQYKM
ncbi:MAG: ceramidase domain-containing protein [bacterium]|nr:ceramidase domain-containing protein [bacterium]